METSTDYGHWQILRPRPDNALGFIYRITNTLNGMQYIGQKHCIFTSKVKVKGRKNRKTVRRESDWKKYTGSCRQLNEDIEKHGIEHFLLEILIWCGSKSELNYFEAKAIMETDAVLREDYYNGELRCRLGRKTRLDVNEDFVPGASRIL